MQITQSNSSATQQIFSLISHPTEPDTKQISALITAGANINARNHNGDTALFLAIKNRHDTIIEWLLKHYPGTIIHSRNKDGNTPLHLASALGYEEIFDILLDHGAKAEARGKDGRTPIHLAAEKGHDQIVYKLISNTCEKRARAMEDKVGPDGHGDTAFHLAVKNKHYDTARTLLEHDSLIHREDPSPLLLAVTYGEDRIVDLVLKFHMQNLPGIAIPPLRHAMQCRNHLGQTPLHIAALQGKIKIIVSLLKNLTCREKEACLSLQDEEGNTPIHLAVKSGKEVAIDTLFLFGLMPSKYKRHANKAKQIQRGPTPLSCPEKLSCNCKSTD